MQNIETVKISKILLTLSDIWHILRIVLSPMSDNIKFITPFQLAMR